MNTTNPRLNASGCPDPTAYEAISAVARSEKAARPYKPLVYIASPYAGDTKTNAAKTEAYCRFAVIKGCIPLAPHLLYPRFLDETDKDERELGLFAALILLGKCDELWVFGGHISEGVSREIAKAKRRGMPIRYFNHKCEEVTQYGD